MSSRRERYTTTTRFVVPVVPPRDESIDTTAVEMPCSNGTLCISLALSRPEGTAVEIRWEFEDWFTEDSGNEIDTTQTIYDLWEQSQVLYLPEAEGFTWDIQHRSIDVAQACLKACMPYLNRYSICTRWPAFWIGLRAREFEAKTTVEAAGRSVVLRSRAFFAAFGLESMPITEACALAIAGSYPRYLMFVSTADERYLEGRVADAVVHLAQGLEVAAYVFARSINPNRKWIFSAPKFFGPKRLEEIAERNKETLSCYQTICELMGARHEWVHEGRAQVRLFEDNENGYAKGLYRPLVRQEYLVFRSAVSETLQWFGEEPIEL